MSLLANFSRLTPKINFMMSGGGGNSRGSKRVDPVIVIKAMLDGRPMLDPTTNIPYLLEKVIMWKHPDNNSERFINNEASLKEILNYTAKKMQENKDNLPFLQKVLNVLSSLATLIVGQKGTQLENLNSKGIITAGQLNVLQQLSTETAMLKGKAVPVATYVEDMCSKFTGAPSVSTNIPNSQRSRRPHTPKPQTKVNQSSSTPTPPTSQPAQNMQQQQAPAQTTSITIKRALFNGDQAKADTFFEVLKTGGLKYASKHNTNLSYVALSSTNIDDPVTLHLNAPSDRPLQFQITVSDQDRINNPSQSDINIIQNKKDMVIEVLKGSGYVATYQDRDNQHFIISYTEKTLSTPQLPSTPHQQYKPQTPGITQSQQMPLPQTIIQQSPQYQQQVITQQQAQRSQQIQQQQYQQQQAMAQQQVLQQQQYQQQIQQQQAQRSQQIQSQQMVAQPSKLLCIDFDSTITARGPTLNGLHQAGVPLGMAAHYAAAIKEKYGLKNPNEMREMIRGMQASGFDVTITSNTPYPELIPMILLELGLTKEEVLQIGIVGAYLSHPEISNGEIIRDKALHIKRAMDMSGVNDPRDVILLDDDLGNIKKGGRLGINVVHVPNATSPDNIVSTVGGTSYLTDLLPFVANEIIQRHNTHTQNPRLQNSAPLFYAHAQTLERALDQTTGNSILVEYNPKTRYVTPTITSSFENSQTKGKWRDGAPLVQTLSAIANGQQIPQQKLPEAQQDKVQHFQQQNQQINAELAAGQQAFQAAAIQQGGTKPIPSIFIDLDSNISPKGIKLLIETIEKSEVKPNIVFVTQRYDINDFAASLATVQINIHEYKSYSGNQLTNHYQSQFGKNALMLGYMDSTKLYEPDLNVFISNNDHDISLAQQMGVNVLPLSHITEQGVSNILPCLLTQVSKCAEINSLKEVFPNVIPQYRQYMQSVVNQPQGFVAQYTQQLPYIPSTLVAQRPGEAHPPQPGSHGYQVRISQQSPQSDGQNL